MNDMLFSVPREVRKWLA